MSEVALPQRTVVLADVSSLFFAAKQAFPGAPSRVNYARLMGGVLTGRQLLKAVAYLIQKPEIDQSKFHEALTKCGFEIKVKHSAPQYDQDRPHVKVSWDIGVTLDALYYATKADVVVIATNDVSFVPLIQELRTRKHTFGHGCVVEVVGFQNSMPEELIKIASRSAFIPQDWTIAEKAREDRPKRYDNSRASAPVVPPNAGEQRIAQLVGGGVDYDQVQPASNVSPRLLRK